MGVSLHTITPAAIPILLSEPEWDEHMSVQSPVPSHNSTPGTSSKSIYASTTTTGTVYGPHQRSLNGTSGALSSPGKHLAEVPTTLFYPFFPEAQANALTAESSGASGTTASGNGQPRDYSQVLKVVAAAQEGISGQPQASYMSEERDVSHNVAQEVVWVNVVCSVDNFLVRGLLTNTGLLISLLRGISQPITPSRRSPG
jgi:hypothetical protein